MKTVSETLKETILACGLSQFELQRRSGANRLSIGRFLAGTSGLSMTQIDMLARYFELELQPARRGRGRKEI